MGSFAVVANCFILLFCCSKGIHGPAENARQQGHGLQLDNSLGLDRAVDGTKFSNCPHKNWDWFAVHKQRVQEMKEMRNASVVFLGDSITERMIGEGHGQAVASLKGLAAGFKMSFTDRYSKHGNAAAFGIVGDRIPHLLWRLQNGESLTRAQPRAIVINIGTNDITFYLGQNFGNHTRLIAENIAMGVQRILMELKEMSPSSVILLTKIFPRHFAFPQVLHVNHSDEVNAVDESNKQLQRVADNLGVRLVDCDAICYKLGSKELDPAILSDFLHPTLLGYKRWFSCLQPVLNDAVLSSPDFLAKDSSG